MEIAVGATLGVWYTRGSVDICKAREMVKNTA